jgi:hypothetical protein
MALNEVPKSGEVWCEGARICLRRGQWNDAKEYLNFAIRFTPQVSPHFSSLCSQNPFEAA